MQEGRLVQNALLYALQYLSQLGLFGFLHIVCGSGHVWETLGVIYDVCVCVCVCVYVCVCVVCLSVCLPA